MLKTKLTSDETADLCGVLIPVLVRRSPAEFDLTQLATTFGAFCLAYGVEVDLDTVFTLAWETNLSLWQMHSDFRRSRAGRGSVAQAAGNTHWADRPGERQCRR